MAILVPLRVARCQKSLSRRGHRADTRPCRNPTAANWRHHNKSPIHVKQWHVCGQLQKCSTSWRFFLFLDILVRSKLPPFNSELAGNVKNREEPASLQPHVSDPQQLLNDSFFCVWERWMQRSNLCRERAQGQKIKGKGVENTLEKRSRGSTRRSKPFPGEGTDVGNPSYAFKSSPNRARWQSLLGRRTV